MNLSIFIENIYENFNIDEVNIYKNTQKITEYFLNNKNIFDSSCLKNYNFDTLNFDIVFCNNDEIHRINKEYRQKDSATDVITFAIFADSPESEKFIIDGEIGLGEIIISLDKIKEQAVENNNSFDEELYYIISHGILHLLGYDHQNEEDYNFMVNAQNDAKAIVL